jgi:hypothetical protein
MKAAAQVRYGLVVHHGLEVPNHVRRDDEQHDDGRNGRQGNAD